MAKNNSTNNSGGSLTLDPGASGDSFVQFDINGTGEFRIGVDDNAADAFKISAGSALGTGDTFVMTAAGERTMPLQPAFFAYNSATNSSVTGDGTTFTVEFDTEIFDQGSDYDNTTDTFTAPVTGRYIFNFAVYIVQLTASHTEGYMQIVTSNRTYQSMQSSPAAIRTVNGDLMLEFSCFADMDASDTTTCTITVDNDTKVVDVGASTTIFTSFQGSLVC